MAAMADDPSGPSRHKGPFFARTGRWNDRVNAMVNGGSAHTQRHLSTYSGRKWPSLVSLPLTRLLGIRQRRLIAQPITATHLCNVFAKLGKTIQPGCERKVSGKE